jgi:1-acyl-sn-glycerol-3-phosphate acyltransferase
MKVLLKPLQWIYSLYAIIMFVATMLIVFLFVIAASFFGKIKGGNFVYKVCKAWGYTWYTLVGMRHKSIYEVPHDQGRQYIFLANHISYIDIPAAMVSINQPMRILAKYEMSKVPVFGFIYRYATILVDRTDAEKRAHSIREMKSFIHKHISIFIYPEGTFNETETPLKEFFDGAFRIAIETQTPLKPILFIDTVDRLHYSSIFSFTPGLCRTVFLQEVPVAGLKMTDVNMLKQKVFSMMEEGLRRYRTYL